MLVRLPCRGSRGVGPWRLSSALDRGSSKGFLDDHLFVTRDFGGRGDGDLDESTGEPRPVQLDPEWSGEAP